MRIKLYLLVYLIVDFNITSSFAQDTLRVMTYNVLHYGDGCQGSNSFLHSQLKIIVLYESPDVLGLVKAQSIKLSATDHAGLSSVGFADSILSNTLNAAYPNKYDYCPLVNFSNDFDEDMDLLFFNKNKLGFLSVSNLCSYQEDFNLYKLYYKDPNLTATKDTTFLYFILNHTVSGASSGSRDYQDSVVVKSLKSKFKHLPNLISMGDFNTHSSYEAGYQMLTATTDSSFIFSDPPFSPDHKISYPASWQDNASLFSSYLNTSTRQTTIPNSCGTTNGAKNWYLHILLSPWIVKNLNYVKYIPNSYSTIGNDGMRVGISINDSTNTKNISVPANVLNALFQFSDKYPIMITLAVTPNTTGISLPDPETKVVTAINSTEGKIFIENPIDNNLIIHFPTEFVGQKAQLQCYDLLGQLVQQNNFDVAMDEVGLDAYFGSGLYVATLTISSTKRTWRLLKK